MKEKLVAKQNVSNSRAQNIDKRNEIENIFVFCANNDSQLAKQEQEAKKKANPEKIEINCQDLIFKKHHLNTLAKSDFLLLVEE